MNADTEKTKVIFRKFIDGEVIALFYGIRESAHMIMSYMHVGQHGAADYHGLLSVTKLATPGEYAALADELRGIGYRLDIRTRATYDFWGKA